MRGGPRGASVGCFCGLLGTLPSCCSKKPSSVRYRELLEGVSGPLLQLATERVGTWVQSKPHAPLLLQVATSVSGE